ncbi:MAG: cation:proton antiporter [Candidatus Hydrothermae bacterium]|nr:cation:proton antiporter [Candidatus Hydrothermae bacterium]
MWYIYAGFTLLGLFLLFLRFILGPTSSDRVVSVDAMTTVTTALLVLFSLFFKRGIYMDVALVYAVLAFITVLAIARYFEGGL